LAPASSESGGMFLNGDNFLARRNLLRARGFHSRFALRRPPRLPRVEAGWHSPPSCHPRVAGASVSSPRKRLFSGRRAAKLGLDCAPEQSLIVRQCQRTTPVPTPPNQARLARCSGCLPRSSAELVRLTTRPCWQPWRPCRPSGRCRSRTRAGRRRTPSPTPRASTRSGSGPVWARKPTNGELSSVPD
jgi:hypothetical protein